MPRFNKKTDGVDDMEKYYKPVKFEKVPIKEPETGADEAKAIKVADNVPDDTYAGPLKQIEPVLPSPIQRTYTPKP